MKDSECVRFLQWALPQLHMRWPGFRRVRGQICKRVGRRISGLGLSGLSGYRLYLAETPAEWSVLDGLCRITISRFYRDRDMFDQLHGPALHRLAEIVRARADTQLRAWSIGCASGEEPYTLAVGVKLLAQPPLRDMKFKVIASDVDATMLARAQLACYSWSSVNQLPPDWLAQAFEVTGQGYRLRPRYRDNVEFRQQDIRTTMADGQFDLILCRNLAFTYFDMDLQCEILTKLLAKLHPSGALVIGKHESLPQGMHRFTEWFPRLGIYRRE